MKSLKSSSRNECYLKIHHWKIKHKDFLNERSDKPNEKGKYPYKHRNVRSALASINRYFDYIFTYEKHSDLNIEKTTNRIEGLFKELKDKLRPHSGLTRWHKILFIQDFLNKKAGKMYLKSSLPTILSYRGIKCKKTSYFVLYAFNAQ